MLQEAVAFTSLFLAGLLAGALFAVWLLFDPQGLTASDYVVVHQQGVRALNVKMPALGLATIAVTALSALLSRADRARLTMLIASVLCFVVAGLVTRLGNQPINAVVMTWSHAALPEGWTVLRDTWWKWHLTRFGATLVGLGLLILATVRGRA